MFLIMTLTIFFTMQPFHNEFNSHYNNAFNTDLIKQFMKNYKHDCDAPNDCDAPVTNTW